jgi:hypothetical protein
MLLKKYSIYLSSFLLAQLAMHSASVWADPSTQTPSETSGASEDVPSEEFWLYMAEFEQDEELIDPDALINDSNLNPQSVKVNSELKNSTATKLPESSEESL